LKLIGLLCICDLSIQHPNRTSKSLDQGSPGGNELYQELPRSKLGIFPQAAVVSDAETCASHGVHVLKEGGTAVDAAITTLLCNGAVHSHSMGLGGGFFMTIYKKDEGKSYFLNAREVAPLQANSTMFVDSSLSSTTGGGAIAVPGEIKGYFEAKERFGNSSIPMTRLVEPVVKMCKEGIKTTRSSARAIEKSIKHIKSDPLLRETFYPDGVMIKEGDLHYRPRLAATLELLAKNGSADPFYHGEMGESIIEELQKQGAILTMDDLKNYRVKLEEPLQMTLSNNLTIHTPTMPSSGIVTAFIIKMLQTALASNKYTTKNVLESYQVFAEACKYGFAQRMHLGDMKDNPVANITKKAIENMMSEDWLNTIMEKLSMDETFEDPNHYSIDVPIRTVSDDHGTTHINVLAPNGDAVSVTSTVNYYFGSKIMSETGIIFNNEMDDFATDPEKPNLYGLFPTEANHISPGRRPLSSMSPTIVVDDKSKRPRLVIGASGGPSIITSVAWVAMHHLLLEKNIKEAIDEPRLHHQLLPMTLRHEKLMPKGIVDHLRDIGHNMTEFDPYFGDGYVGARVQAIASHSFPEIDILTANNDKRKSGSTDGF